MRQILLADNCPIVRRGLKDMVRRFPDWKVSGEASNGAELFTLLSKALCQLVILDPELQSTADPLAVLHHMRRDFRGPAVLVYASTAQEQLALRAMQSGADGYLTKDSSEDELVDAICTLLDGGRYVCARLEHRLAWLQISHKAPNFAFESLSEREKQVFEALAAGQRPKEIAAELSLNAKTVSCYRHRLFEKLGIKSNADLVRLAVGIQPALEAN